jgi:NADPH:quinone reductase-like Zn-dependent oxidoreductase
MSPQNDTTMNPATPAGVIATEVVLPGVVEPSGLQVRQRTLAPPAARQALVRVEASGVSFAEQAMRRNRYPGQPKFPFVPGYDLVGTVAAVGPGVDPTLIDSRVAALTKTGGWASHALLAARDLVPVPAGIDPAEAETLVVNGLTAWQMLHRKAAVERCQTIVVHGANGGVGTTLVQLARHAGVRVIGTASPRHHDALRELGAEPIDYNDTDLNARVRELAPNGVDAVFDHIGGTVLDSSYAMLAPKGTLVSYAIASMPDTGSMYAIFAKHIARLIRWNLAPNGHKATFYDVWGGHLVRPARFRQHLRDDLAHVFELLATGVLTAQVAARLPLDQAAVAMELAQSRTAFGKVVLVA